MLMSPQTPLTALISLMKNLVLICLLFIFQWVFRHPQLDGRRKINNGPRNLQALCFSNLCAAAVFQLEAYLTNTQTEVRNEKCNLQVQKEDKNILQFCSCFNHHNLGTPGKVKLQREVGHPSPSSSWATWAEQYEKSIQAQPLHEVPTEARVSPACQRVQRIFFFFFSFNFEFCTSIYLPLLLLGHE